MKTVLVTGATSGFGEMLVGRFLDGGYRVVATGRDLQKRKEIFSVLRPIFADRLIELSLDVTKSNEIQSVAEFVGSQFSGLDILINNAGYGYFCPLEEAVHDEVRRQMEVNFFGTLFMTQKFLPLLRRNHGCVFNFSSVFGFMGFPLTGLYCASKFAVEGLTESLRGELRPHGVQVCLIQPGGYRTRFGESLFCPSTPPQSPYANQMGAYQKLREKQMTKVSQNPMDVVNGVFHLAERSSLPLRATFGRDARFAKLIRRFLPNKIYQYCLDKVFSKIFTLDKNSPSGG